MGDLSRNLSRSEFRCQCGQCNHEAVDKALVDLIQDTRDLVSAKMNRELKIFINSGNRCPEHNKKEGGSPSSKHMFGLAADWWLYTGSNSQQGRINMKPIYDFLIKKYTVGHGIAFYKNSAGKTRIHTDTATRYWRKNYAI